MQCMAVLITTYVVMPVLGAAQRVLALSKVGQVEASAYLDGSFRSVHQVHCSCKSFEPDNHSESSSVNIQKTAEAFTCPSL